MPGFTLLKGTVFDWSGTRFKIERVQANGELLLERIDNGQLALRTKDEVLAEYRSGRISAQSSEAPKATSAPAFSRPLNDLPLVTQAEVKRRTAYVRALLDLGSFTFSTSFIQPLINEVAHRINDPKPPGNVTLWRWVSRYRSTGDLRSLIPRTDLRGSRKSPQAEEVLQFLTSAAEEAFKASPLAKAQGVHDRLLSKIECANRQKASDEQLPRPSLRTTYRRIAGMQAYDQSVLREGKPAADKRFRLVKAGVRPKDILERVEIDHTPLDLFLIDEKTWLPLGRPTLTVLIDHYSRMILGYYLSFGNPSAAAVMGALRHAILPKERAQGVLQNIVTEHQWTCFGKPNTLVMDNGLEFHGKDVESVCDDLNIHLFYCPKHTPRFKGVVERFLKTINYFFAHQLPGTSFSRLHERGDYDPQKHALLTLSEFKQIFEKWVIDIYSRTTHRTLGVTPTSKWEEGLARREPTLPASVFDLQKRIGKVNERSLRRDGILLNGIRYSGPELQQILMKYGEGITVRTVYDPEDLGFIQVWGPDQEEAVTAFAVDQSYASNLTSTQNELIQKLLRDEGAAKQDKAALQRARQQLATSIEELMASRKQKHRRKAAGALGISSSKPHASIDDLTPQTKPTLAPSHPRPKKTPPPNSAVETEAPVMRYASFQLKG